jgi:protein phosphatase
LAIVGDASVQRVKDSTPARTSLTSRTASIGLYYMLGAATCALLAWSGWPWTAPLAWPALTLGLVASGYFGVGARIYGKRNGELPRWRCWLLAADQWGQALAWRYYRRKREPWSVIAPRVWMGAWPDADASRELLAAGVRALVDLTAEFPAAPLARLSKVNVLHLYSLDLTVPAVAELRRAAHFIEEQSAGGVVYIHCKAGYFRSAAVAGAWLLWSGATRSPAEAVRLLERARPGLHVRRPVRQALDAFARELAARGRTSGAERGLRWVRDIRRRDPALFDLIFRIQDLSYRRNRVARGLVWSYDAFCERADDYVLFGRLPARDADGNYPCAADALAAGAGFVLGRPLPKDAPRPLCLKLSVVAGRRRGVVEACAQARALGVPVFAAVEPRLTGFATRIGFRILPAPLGRVLLPLLVPAFVNAPWTYRGVSRAGEVLVTHPQFRDPASGEEVVYAKKIIHTPGALRQLLRPGVLAAAAGSAARARARRRAP